MSSRLLDVLGLSPRAGNLPSGVSDSQWEKQASAAKLKQGIAETASLLSVHRKLQCSDRETTPRDERTLKNEEERLRMEALRKRNEQANALQREERARRAEALREARRRDRDELAAANRRFLAERQLERMESQARAAEYRKALELQRLRPALSGCLLRQVKVVTERFSEVPSAVPLPANLCQLAFDLPEFQQPVYTIQHPKPVATDPITGQKGERSQSELQMGAKEEKGRKGMREFGQMSLRLTSARTMAVERLSAPVATARAGVR